MTATLIDVAVPEGYEVSGAFRKAAKGEWFINLDGKAEQMDLYPDLVGPRIILREKPRVPKVGEVWKNPIGYEAVVVNRPAGWSNNGYEIGVSLQPTVSFVGLTAEWSFLASSVAEWASKKWGGL